MEARGSSPVRVDISFLRAKTPLAPSNSLYSCPFATFRHSLHLTNSDQKGTIFMAKATFAAGCFWGVEAAFRRIPGVLGTRVGYLGGKTENPTYQQVCTDTTGHAEAVEVEFDPAKTPYASLLNVFWENHNPTQVNRQGPDVGAQYRSAIFFHSPEQEAEARASKETLDKSGKYKAKIATQIVPEATFYPAEDYHQQYLEKRGLATCHI